MPTPVFRSANLPRISEAVIGWLLAANHQSLAPAVQSWDRADWETARWAVQIHGIGPLLDRAAERWPDAQALHPLLRTYLTEQRARSAARVALLLGDLAEILSAFAAAGIAAMPLKGAQLATRFYPEPGLRPMNDLDILVRPADEDRAIAQLKRLGYRRLSRSWKHTLLAKPEAHGPTVARDGEHPDNPRSLDLHTRVAEQFWGIGYEITAEAWAGAEQGSLIGQLAWLMPPATLLHHLIIHATSDTITRRVRFLHLHDIALVAAHLDRSDWERIVAAAEARGEQRYIYSSLALAARYFPVVPPDVLAALRPGVPPALLRYLDESGLDRVSICNPDPTGPVEKLRWYRPGRERLVALRHIVLPDPGELASWFPWLSGPALVPLAYLGYGGQMLAWAARRLRGRPRRMLVAPETTGE